jgi:hypothetical protein
MMKTLIAMRTDILRSAKGTKAIFFVDATRPFLDMADRTIFSTIGEGVSKGMIRHISPTYEQEAYFDQCKPETCTYYRVRPLTVVGVFTVILGVLGGLSVAFRTGVGFAVGLLKPCIVRIFPDLKPDPTKPLYPRGHFEGANPMAAKQTPESA